MQPFDVRYHSILNNILRPEGMATALCLLLRTKDCPTKTVLHHIQHHFHFQPFHRSHTPQPTSWLSPPSTPTTIVRPCSQDFGFKMDAPVCSSFVWINRATSQRSDHAPLGDITKECVRNANLMASRVIALLYLAAAAQIFWILEQPSSSLFEHLPRFQQLLGVISV